MCRYIAYVGSPVRLSDLIYEPTNSLIHQASEAMESPTRINADGFGIGWYAPDLDPAPAVFKAITPAWSNANLRSLARRVASGCVFGHVRASRRFDPVNRANCHPFQIGRLLWMHNGDIPGRGRLHRRVTALASDALVARIRGNTDSELAFVLFASLLARGPGGEHEADDLLDTLRQTVHTLVEWRAKDGDERDIALNFCVTDGTVIVASRFARGGTDPPSLHYCTGSRYVCRDGECRVLDTGDGRCSLIASEELSAGPEWVAVEPDRLVVVRPDRAVRTEPLDV